MTIKRLTAIISAALLLATVPTMPVIAQTTAHTIAPDSRLNLPADVIHHRSNANASHVNVSAPPASPRGQDYVTDTYGIGSAPDGSVVAIADSRNNQVQIWSLPQRALLNTISVPNMVNYYNAIPILGNQVIAVSEEDNVNFYSTLQGNRLASLNLGSTVLGLSLSPNGQRLAAATENGITIWRLDDGSVELMLGNGINDSWMIKPAPMLLTDDTLIYLTPEHSLNYLDLASRSERSYPLPQNLQPKQITAYGVLLEGEVNEDVQFFDPRSGRISPVDSEAFARFMPGDMYTSIFGLDENGQLLAERDNQALSLDLATGTVRQLGLANPQRKDNGWEGTDTVRMVGNNAIAIEYNGKSISVINSKSGAISELGKASAMDEAAHAYIAARGLLVTTSDDKMYFNYLNDPSRNRIIDISGNECAEMIDNLVYGLDESGASHIYASPGYDAPGWRINLDTYAIECQDYDPGVETNVGYTMYGSHQVPTDDYNRMYGQWERTQISSFRDDMPAQVRAVAASIGLGEDDSFHYYPDGNLIEHSYGQSIDYYDARTGKKRLSSYIFADGEWVMMTPEGFFAASPHGAEAITVNQGFDSFSIAQAYDVLNRPDLVAASFYGDPQGLVAEAAATLDLNRLIHSGTPPTVTFTTDNATQTNQREYRITADLADNGGGIGKLEWRVNGVMRNVAQRGMAAISGTRTTTTLALDPGDNVIELVAYNRDDLIASKPAQISVRYQPDGSAARHDPDLYILSIGVNDYADKRLRLNYAVPDAEAIGNAFDEAGQGLFNRVHRTTITNEQVNRDQLERTFAELGNSMKPEDVFLFFIAGHGKTQDGRYYFIPHDFTYDSNASYKQQGIGQDQWQAWFAQIPAQKSVLLYDTCESGSMTRQGERGLDSLERDTAIEKLNKATGRTILAATNDDAPALEGYGGHGIFTYSILEGVNSADSNNDGRIDLSELINYIQQRVPDISESAFGISQTPRIQTSGNSFPVANVMQLLDPSAIQNYPRTATHAVKGGSTVYSAPNSQAQVNQTIANNVLYTIYLIEDNNGWAAIAKDGKPVGYVPSSQLVPLQ